MAELISTLFDDNIFFWKLNIVDTAVIINLCQLRLVLISNMSTGSFFYCFIFPCHVTMHFQTPISWVVFNEKTLFLNTRALFAAKLLSYFQQQPLFHYCANEFTHNFSEITCNIAQTVTQPLQLLNHATFVAQARNLCKITF
jgi:hypothetical protein